MRGTLLTLTLLTGCASLPVAPEPPQPPDLSPMVEFVGRYGVSHGCPLGPETIYTAAHVPDESRPFDRDAVPYPQRMSLADGSENLAQPAKVSAAADVALMKPLAPLPRWFARARVPPSVGERLWTLGYRLGPRAHLFEPRLVTSRVVRVIGGHVVLELGAKRGASGACWVNALGQAVAIVNWDLPGEPDDGQTAGMAVGIWDPWTFADDGQPAEVPFPQPRPLTDGPPKE